VNAVETRALEPGSPEWHAERRKGIGGSDWKDVLNLEPYGCRRRLYFEKTATPPDFPERDNGRLRRGHALEPIVVEEYVRITGNRVTGPTPRPTQEWLPGWWVGNPDRIIAAPDARRGPGVLECKTANEWVYWQAVSEGASEAWVAQLHHYLVLGSYRWGEIAVLEVDSFRLFREELERDPELVDLMLRRGEEFWAAVQTRQTPGALDPSDKRCRTCPWRITCHGAELYDPEFAPEPTDWEDSDDPEIGRLLEDYADLREKAKEADKALEEQRVRLHNRLGWRPRKIKAGPWKVELRRTVRRTLDADRIKADHPELVKTHRNESVSFSLLVK